MVGFIGGSNNDKYIVGRSSRPVAVGYDPVQQVYTVKKIFKSEHCLIRLVDSFRKSESEV